MEPRAFVQSVRWRPGMYGAGTWRETVALIRGYHIATPDPGLLTGFHEWLVLRTDDRWEVNWTGQVAHLVFSDSPDRWDDDGLSKSEVDHLRDEALGLLDEFLAERDRRGLEEIRQDYRSWHLRRGTDPEDLNCVG